MAIKEILKKLVKRKEDGELRVGMIPEERELMSYKEEDRRRRIRAEVARYRMKKNKDAILGGSLIEEAKAVHGTPNILKAKKILAGKNTLTQRNIFNHKENILKTKPTLKQKKIF